MDEGRLRNVILLQNAFLSFENTSNQIASDQLGLGDCVGTRALMSCSCADREQGEEHLVKGYRRCRITGIKEWSWRLSRVKRYS